MNLRLLTSLLLVIGFCQCAANAAEPLDMWISKARASIGSEADLDKVNSLHFVGTLEATGEEPDPADSTKTISKPLRLEIEIYFQKPDRQLMTVRSEKVMRVTGLDGIEGWVKHTPDLSQPGKWGMTLLPPVEVRRLRANTWETLNFYRGVEQRGGHAELLGDELVDGRHCVKILFRHDADAYYTRWVDKEDGRLVKTETESGAEIREQGEIISSGLRFPQRIITKLSDGQETIITFKTVVVNQPLSASEFAVPEIPLTH